MNQKGLSSIVLVVMLIFIVIIGAARFLLWANKPETAIVSPTPDETANWQTYRNEKYGFEAKYPNNSMTSDKVGIESEVRFTGINSDNAIFGINISENSNTPVLSNFISNPEMYKKIETKKQNNIVWNIAWFGGSGFGKNPIFASAIKNGYVFEIYLDRDTEEASLEDIYKIISTFNFLGKNETADWKTYSNDKYGFEFKYPLDWMLKLGIAPNVSGSIIYEFIPISTITNGPVFIISQNEHSSLADLQIAYHANQSGETSPYQKSYKEKQVLIGDNLWWKIDRVIGSLQGDINSTFYWVSHGNNTFFTFDSDPATIKILSTFKFTE